MNNQTAPPAAPRETFRQFYERRTKAKWPADGPEEIHVVLRRIADQSADWMDELARRQKDGQD